MYVGFLLYESLRGRLSHAILLKLAATVTSPLYVGVSCQYVKTFLLFLCVLITSLHSHVAQTSSLLTGKVTCISCFHILSFRPVASSLPNSALFLKTELKFI